MFWNNQIGKEKEEKKARERAKQKERETYTEKKNICAYIERSERLSILLDTLSERHSKEKSYKQRRSNAMLLLFIFINLAGSLVAFDTTIENYTVPVSGKCILTCYVAEVRSFKVSQSYSFFLHRIVLLLFMSTEYDPFI